MSQRSIIISAADRDRLIKLMDSARMDSRIPPEHIAALEHEIVRATITEPAELPADVVALNSTVWFRDLESEEIERYTLVFPHEADVQRHRISVLAPIGTAILGYRLGDVVEWPVPKGKLRLEIIKVAHLTADCQAESEEVLV